VPQNANPDPNQVNQIEVPPVYADDVVSVASVDPTTGAPSPFTVWGPWVTIAAPGQRITSVDPAANGTVLSDQTLDKASRSRCRAPVSRRRTWPVSWPWSGPGSRP